MSSTEPEDLAREMDAVPLWHQRIELAPGLVTPGAQDTQTLLQQVQLPEDLSGRRVLDVGARDGFFSFEAERRGAEQVVAVDYVPAEATGFSMASKALGSRVEWHTGSVYDITPEQHGHFDVVLFLGVLYHLRHPLMALDRLFDVCRPGGTILLETHMIDEGLVDRDGNPHRMSDFNEDLVGFPLMQIFAGTVLNADPTNQFAPNKEGLRGLLQASGFDVTHLWQSGTRGGGTGRRQADVPLERLYDEAKDLHSVKHRRTSDDA